MKREPVTSDQRSISEVDADWERDEEAARAKAYQYKQELEVIRSLRAADERPVVESLQKAGWAVDSIWDLVNAKYDYDGAIPILLQHLGGDYFPSTKEAIARALTLKSARPAAAQPLISEFLEHDPQSKSEEHSKWAIGHALTLTGDDSVFDQIADTLRDKRHGWTRAGLVSSLPNMRRRREEAFQLALELTEDEDVANEAMVALGNFRDIRGRPVVEAFLQNSDSWVRQKAKQALAKIDRKAGSATRTGPQ